MVAVAFHDSGGRPLAGAVVSIAASPGEVNDIAMIADDHGEISITPSAYGLYEFAVFSGAAVRNVRTQINEGDETLTVEVG